MPWDSLKREARPGDLVWFAEYAAASSRSQRFGIFLQGYDDVFKVLIGDTTWTFTWNLVREGRVLSRLSDAVR